MAGAVVMKGKGRAERPFIGRNEGEVRASSFPIGGKKGPERRMGQKRPHVEDEGLPITLTLSPSSRRCDGTIDFPGIEEDDNTT